MAKERTKKMKNHLNLLFTLLLVLGLAFADSARGQVQDAPATTTANSASWQGPKLRVMVMDLNSSGLLKNVHRVRVTGAWDALGFTAGGGVAEVLPPAVHAAPSMANDANAA